jgi:hypothetical protein
MEWSPLICTLRQTVNGEAADVNITADCCMYPGQKLVQLILSNKTHNATKHVSLNPGKMLASGE